MIALEDLSTEDLRDEVRDLLHIRGTAVGRLDRRAQQLPQAMLAESYRRGDDDYRNRLVRVLENLLNEMPQWDRDPSVRLSSTIEVGAIKPLREPLVALAQSQRLLAGDSSYDRQAALLRSVKALGWRGESKFWLDQHEKLGKKYPDLIFSALVATDLSAAFEALGKLMVDVNSARRILLTLPRMVEEHGLDALRSRFESVLNRFSLPVVQHVDRWFRVRGGRGIASRNQREQKPAHADPVREPQRSGSRVTVDGDGFGRAWGYHLIVDCFGCSVESCCNLNKGYEFLDKICLFLKVTKQTQPYIFKTCDSAFPGRPGYSGWVPIIESGIQIHTSAADQFISIDVYSCKTYNPQQVIDFVQDWFQPTYIETQMIHRGRALDPKNTTEIDLTRAKNSAA